MPKCVNCGSNHPANYRGCEVTKKLQEMKNETIKNKVNKITLRNNRISESSKVAGKTNQTNNADRVKTYSQAAQQGTGIGTQEEGNNNVTLIKLMEKLENQDQKYEEQGQAIKDLLQRFINLENKNIKAAMPNGRKQ